MTLLKSSKLCLIVLALSQFAPGNATPFSSEEDSLYARDAGAEYAEPMFSELVQRDLLAARSKVLQDLDKALNVAGRVVGDVGKAVIHIRDLDAREAIADALSTADHTIRSVDHEMLDARDLKARESVIKKIDGVFKDIGGAVGSFAKGALHIRDLDSRDTLAELEAREVETRSNVGKKIGGFFKDVSGAVASFGKGALGMRDLEARGEAVDTLLAARDFLVGLEHEGLQTRDLDARGNTMQKIDSALNAAGGLAGSFAKGALHFRRDPKLSGDAKLNFAGGIINAGSNFAGLIHKRDSIYERDPRISGNAKLDFAGNLVDAGSNIASSFIQHKRDSLYERDPRISGNAKLDFAGNVINAGSNLAGLIHKRDSLYEREAEDGIDARDLEDFEAGWDF
ncbi:hypothetical protein MMC18_008010 [Xylographa bjoerkii]|nr:hypothetical protein [Xylographa bjoerkii]